MTEPFAKPTLGRIIKRGITRRCPRCGKGKVFKRWVTLHDNCSECGLQYLRDQGDLWGYLLFVDRAMFIFPLVVMFYFGWWNPGSFWYWGVIGLLIAGMVYTIPHRNAISVGLDYMVRTRTEDSE
ncbi:MAG: DUF983 domain-containing protein [Pirellulaceae bacterium]